MRETYAYFRDLGSEVEPPVDGTLSRTLVNTEQIKIVLFGFAEGQELSEHTASMPAVLQFISGEAAVKLGDDWVEAERGSLIHMPAGLPHAIRAKTPAVMLLLLLKSAGK
jgi:quercetin dioxygenase-like cupin family protein